MKLSDYLKIEESKVSRGAEYDIPLISKLRDRKIYDRAMISSMGKFFILYCNKDNDCDFKLTKVKEVDGNRMITFMSTDDNSSGDHLAKTRELEEKFGDFCRDYIAKNNTKVSESKTSNNEYNDSSDFETANSKLFKALNDAKDIACSAKYQNWMKSTDNNYSTKVAGKAKELKDLVTRAGDLVEEIYDELDNAS